ncbi:striatin-3-like [Symsagittifera roscoffensis]|uniref:striatin-3-like n=1 Tax=Symsagittifera roscoffensis TaxID=84072 RepID=UPI00307C8308
MDENKSMNNQQQSNNPGQKSAPEQMQYSIPGILHFIQHEWTRFEMERAHWDVERAELQARIGFLTGERKGQENLKRDLVRRIKMLEYALKQERLKNQSGKANVPMPIPDFDEDETDEMADNLLSEPQQDELTMQNAVSLQQGRKLLRTYLKEIGYTDSMLEVKAAKINSILGLVGASVNDVPPFAKSKTGGLDYKDFKLSEALNAVNAADNEQGNQMSGPMVDVSFLDAAVKLDKEMEDFDNENSVGGSKKDDDAIDSVISLGLSENDGEDELGFSEATDEESIQREFDAMFDLDSTVGGDVNDGSSNAEGDAIGGTEDAWASGAELAEKKKEQYKKEKRAGGAKSTQRVKTPGTGAIEQLMQQWDAADESSGSSPNFPPKFYGSASGGVPGSGDEPPGSRKGSEMPGENLGALGELARLTISNEAAPLQYDPLSNSVREDYRKTWNIKYTLRSHFDSVRCVAFHPTDQVVVTGSEDHTLKLWNLAKCAPQSSKKNATPEFEPVYTFRAHLGPVLNAVIAPDGDKMFSCSTDGTIHSWMLPNGNNDPYDPYETTVSLGIYKEHKDAVWDLAYHPSKPLLLSASADCTVKLWRPLEDEQTPLLQTFESLPDDGVPVSCTFVRTDSNQAVVGFSSSSSVLYDIETGQQIVRFTPPSDTPAEPFSPKQVNKIVNHPTSSQTITAHEDKYLRFFDHSSGKMVHQMVAHLDSITSLATDPSGLYLLSGSHDCSVRLWNLESKTCVQEVAAHRKKHDESIYSVAFHPTKEFFASAGADALAKIFV